MSGGHFDYRQYSLNEIAEQLDNLVNRRDEDFYRFSDKTVGDMVKTANSLRLAAIYLQRIDWLVSGDDSEESYHKRLAEELEQFKNTRETELADMRRNYYDNAQ